MVLSVLHDAYRAVVMLAYTDGTGEKMNKAFEDTVHRKFAQLDKFIGDKEWVTGSLSVADFVLVENLCWYVSATKGAFLDRYGGKKSNFYRIYSQFMSIPSIRAYNTSTRNQRPWIFNNTVAKWRGPKLRLAYWPIKGRAEPIRMLLEFLNLPYDDHRYPFGAKHPLTGEPIQVRDDLIRKETKMDFPNTPSLTDFKGHEFSEGIAIYQYLA